MSIKDVLMLVKGEETKDLERGALSADNGIAWTDRRKRGTHEEDATENIGTVTWPSKSDCRR
jgi:hypothetical protein